jgi:hypothetical protein
VEKGLANVRRFSATQIAGQYQAMYKKISLS